MPFRAYSPENIIIYKCYGKPTQVQKLRKNNNNVSDFFK